MQLTTNCRTCGLFQYVSSPQVLGRGNTTCPKIIMIGEAPGADEDKIGKPFMGRAGKMLDKMIKNYADVTYLTNAVKCFPPACKTDLSKGFRTPKESNKIQLDSFEIIVAREKPVANVRVSLTLTNEAKERTYFVSPPTICVTNSLMTQTVKFSRK